MTLSPRRALFACLAAKYPILSTNALGRMAYRQCPAMFPNEKAAIRVAFLARNGNKDHKPYLAKTKFNPGYAFNTASTLQRLNASTFKNFPSGKRHFENWGPIQFTGPFRALILQDLHIPYHDKRAIMAAIDYGKQRDANLILLNGDIIDFFTLSFWEKDPRKRDLAGEIKTLRTFLESLRAAFPKADLVYKLGNHEERWERYFFVKAPELLGVPEFEIDKILGLRDGELIGDKEPIQLGDLNVIHGHEYRFAISNPVNPARGLFLRAKAMALCGHFHQSSQHTEKTVEEKNMATWSAGCLCDLHPDYRPMNNWNHGFAFVTVHTSGNFEVENKYINHSGKIY
jgi:predicted phosphodiesterase